MKKKKIQALNLVLPMLLLAPLLLLLLLLLMMMMMMSIVLVPRKQRLSERQW